jgi:predicted small secreted protein
MKTLLIVALSFSLGLLSACNTIHGLGQDIQKAGSTIEDAAKKK